MRKMDHYGLQMCKFQGELFQESLRKTQCGSKVFLRRFMLSDLAERMDKDGFLFEATDIGDAFIEIETQYGPTNYGQIKFGGEALYWTGYLYRYWSYISGKSSKQLYRIMKPEELEKLYFPYHSLDPEQAIERIMEAKGLKEEDEIARGVEIMRRVRAKWAAKEAQSGRASE